MPPRAGLEPATFRLAPAGIYSLDPQYELPVFLYQGEGEKTAWFLM
jgi:hypothetical protein